MEASTRKVLEQIAGYLGTINVFDREDIEEKAIQQRFGGGTYYLQIRNTQGRYEKHKTLRIAGPPTVLPEHPAVQTNASQMLAEVQQSVELDALKERLAHVESKIDALWAYFMNN